MSVRALAAAAVRSRRIAERFPGGILALDYFGDADLRSLESGRPLRVLSLSRDLGRPRTVAALARAALEFDWQGFIYAGGLENRPRLLGRLERRGAALGNGRTRVEAVRDPSVLFAFLAREGFPHPRTWAGAAAPSAAPGSRCLWKGARSGGGTRVRPARPGEPRPRGHYLQEWVRGRPGSAAFLADGSDAILLGVTEQLSGFRPLGGSGYRYGGNIAGPALRLLPSGALDLLRSAATALTRRFGLRGLNGLDFVLSAGRPRILEVNPRYTASMELLQELSGANLVDLHLDAVAGVPLPAERLPEAARDGADRAAPDCLGKGILYAEHRTRGAAPSLLARHGCRDLPAEGEVIEPGHPICTLIVSAATRSLCRRRLVERAALVRALLRPARPARAREALAPGSW